LPIGSITLNSIIQRDEVRRYDVAAAELNTRWLEKQLNADARIQVQEYVKKWIEERAGQSDEESKSVPTQAVPPKAPMPKWKPVETQICKGQSLTTVQSGVDLFTSFKKYVWTVSAKSSNSTAAALGTAVAIGPNLLATNCHVIGTHEEITVTQDGATHKASLVAGDAKKDACLLEVKNSVPFATNSVLVSRLQVGTTSYALGNPQGMNLTFSNGIVSGVRKSNGLEFIQTTAPISKGSSGGALVDDRGNLLGITTFYLQGGQAMNFAIPIEEFCK
jgi:S1-C subfamily serine protease